MHVPVHSAEEGGPADGRPDERGPGADEVPERVPAGKRRGEISLFRWFSYPYQSDDESQAKRPGPGFDKC